MQYRKMLLSIIIVFVSVLIVPIQAYAVEYENSHNTAAVSLSEGNHVVLSTGQSFAKQMTKPNTVYEIRNSFNLGGKTIKVPDNCTLFFNGGIIRNGRLKGDFIIQANEYQIFDDVSIDNVKNSVFYAVWLLGNTTDLNNAFFSNLPKTRILFNPNITYKVTENIILHNREYTYFSGLHLTSDYSIIKNGIKASSSGIISGNCRSSGDIRNRIQTNDVVSSDVIGKMIIVQTCNHVKYDWRETDTMIPQLYKGLTSRITDVKFENNMYQIYIEHPLEKFDNTTTYVANNKTKTKIKSVFNIYRSDIVILEDCQFVFTTRAGYCHFTASGPGSRIVNSSFQSTTGCGMLLGVGGVGMLIQNCIVSGAYYSGSGESYGIQVNGGTAVTIDGCTLDNNRRAIDFSGNWESRYCIAKNNTVSNSTYVAYGSAMGGHSTSFGNQFLNNKICGYHTSAFELRGEQEIVDGNICDAFLSSCFVQVGINSVIRNNFADFYYMGAFVYNNIGIPDNTCIIENNKVFLRDFFINDRVYEPTKIPTYIVKNNTIRIANGRLLASKSNSNPISVFMNNIVTGEGLNPDLLASVEINPETQQLDGITLPLTLKKTNGKELKDSDKAKINNPVVGYVDFLPNHQVRVRLNFSLNNNLSEGVTLNGLYNNIVIPRSSDLTPATTVYNKGPKQKKIIISGDMKKNLGLGTSSGILEAGSYLYEGYL
jgi:hypothetical protein